MDKYLKSSNKQEVLHQESKSCQQVKTLREENLNVDYMILFKRPKADNLFQQLEKDMKYYDGDLAQVKVYGKWHPIPRKQVAYGDDGVYYKYSGNRLPAKPWSNVPALLEIKKAVEDALDKQYLFNFVLINRYKDGSDHMGEHRDDEKELAHGAPIASVSLGQARDFIFKHKDNRAKNKSRTDLKPVSILLQPGSLLVMKPPTNTFWYHSLPIRKNVLLPRINLTFRVIS
ncbi:DNA oxidative demethylase ALKBH2-like [Clavelina lepadiformis]|uniref:DNA oxidative demethylase ALKBH2-like n=1 Tax=Clavelina lepadiformis TaxID=159417 RepID=UPI004042D4C0